MGNKPKKTKKEILEHEISVLEQNMAALEADGLETWSFDDLKDKKEKLKKMKDE